jgi:hypothetical protein
MTAFSVVIRPGTVSLALTASLDRFVPLTARLSLPEMFQSSRCFGARLVPALATVTSYRFPVKP